MPQELPAAQRWPHPRLPRPPSAPVAAAAGDSCCSTLISHPPSAPCRVRPLAPCKYPASGALQYHLLCRPLALPPSSRCGWTGSAGPLWLPALPPLHTLLSLPPAPAMRPQWPAMGRARDGRAMACQRWLRSFAGRAPKVASAARPWWPAM
jgi:hypothetical protein